MDVIWWNYKHSPAMMFILKLFWILPIINASCVYSNLKYKVTTLDQSMLKWQMQYIKSNQIKSNNQCIRMTVLYFVLIACIQSLSNCLWKLYISIHINLFPLWSYIQTDGWGLARWLTSPLLFCLQEWGRVFFPFHSLSLSLCTAIELS